MGVNLNFYVYFGVRVPYDFEFAYAYDEIASELEDTSHVLFDGMSGEYVIIGQRLWDSGDARYAYEGSDGYKEIAIDENFCKSSKDYLINFFKFHLPKYASYLQKEWTLVFVPHYH
jgi:hypothetical protein